ncbi:MAG: methyl-accepting chemotaxis protein [Rhodocyclaceae bacterium]|nr:methyl-accepting chemotaxis protein [Rhodocyclaceae bacterium]
MFKNLSLRWKLLVPVMALVAIVLALVASAVHTAREASAITQELGKRYLPATAVLLEADRDLYQALVAERTWLTADGDAALEKRLRKQVDDNRQQSAQRVDRFADYVAAIPELATAAAPLIAQYRKHRAEWEQANDRVMALAGEGGPSALAEARQLSLGQAEAAFEAMRDQIDQLTEVIGRGAETAEAASSESAADSLMVAGVGGTIGVVVALLIAVFIPRQVVTPLSALNRRLGEMAAGGADLTTRLPVNSNDEIGQLATNFNTFQTSLGQLFRSLHSDADTLAAGVKDLARTVRHVAGRSESLTDISTANAASIEEITVSVSHIADNSADTEAMARSAGGLTVSAATEVATIASQVSASAERVRDLANVLSELDRRSGEIHGIVGVIREIADQTNLLALNAAIEAARAGEQGRGFAVVADEVRKLAERTGNATLEITTMLGGMRDETQHAVEFMRETESTVKASVEMTEAARVKIGDIGDQVQSVAERMTSVADAIREQRSATSMIAQSTETITTQVQETDAELQQAGRTIDALATVAGRTQEQFARFRT